MNSAIGARSKFKTTGKIYLKPRTPIVIINYLHRIGDGSEVF